MEDEEALVHLQEALVKSIQRFRSLQQNFPSISLDSLNNTIIGMSTALGSNNSGGNNHTNPINNQVIIAQSIHNIAASLNAVGVSLSTDMRVLLTIYVDTNPNSNYSGVKSTNITGTGSTGTGTPHYEELQFASNSRIVHGAAGSTTSTISSVNPSIPKGTTTTPAMAVSSTTNTAAADDHRLLNLLSQAAYEKSTHIKDTPVQTIKSVSTPAHTSHISTTSGVALGGVSHTANSPYTQKPVTSATLPPTRSSPGTNTVTTTNSQGHKTPVNGVHSTVPTSNVAGKTKQVSVPSPSTALPPLAPASVQIIKPSTQGWSTTNLSSSHANASATAGSVGKIAPNKKSFLDIQNEQIEQEAKLLESKKAAAQANLKKTVTSTTSDTSPAVIVPPPITSAISIDNSDVIANVASTTTALLSSAVPVTAIEEKSTVNDEVVSSTTTEPVIVAKNEPAAVVEEEDDDDGESEVIEEKVVVDSHKNNEYGIVIDDKNLKEATDKEATDKEATDKEGDDGGNKEDEEKEDDDKDDEEEEEKQIDTKDNDEEDDNELEDGEIVEDEDNEDDDEDVVSEKGEEEEDNDKEKKKEEEAVSPQTAAVEENIEDVVNVEIKNKKDEAADY